MNIKNDAKILKFLEDKDYRIQPNGVIEKVAYFRDLKLGKGVTKPVWKPVGWFQHTGPKVVRYDRAFLMVKRIIWTLHFGPLEPGQSVIVKDGNEGNCHPENLALETTTDVQIRAYRSGRKAANSKLTWNDAKKLRSDWNTGQYTQRKLAEKYQVSAFAVSLCVRNKTYKNEINHNAGAEHEGQKVAEVIGVDVTDDQITLSPGINNKDKGAA